MKRSVQKTLLAAVLTMTLSMILGDVGRCQEEPLTVGGASLLPSGAAVKDPIDLGVAADQPAGRALRPGDPVVFGVLPPRPGYLTVLQVTGAGAVTILFPNAQVKLGPIPGESRYTVFDRKSEPRVLAHREDDRASLVFLLSPEPLDLSPMEFRRVAGCIDIPSDASSELAFLKSRIEQLASGEWWAKKILRLKDESGRNLALRPAIGLGIAPTSRPAPASLKGLPQAIESSEPNPVTGAPGRHQGGPDDEREKSTDVRGPSGR